ncbi:MAG: HvfB family MNIO-type RiPP peptide maturase [Bacteroidia bacterium]
MNISGKTGIGFRKDFADEFLNEGVLKPNFIEVAPENWIDMGGYWKKIFDKVTAKYPLTCHGLSLSIGSPDELDWDFLKKLKVFMKQYNVQIYSEHLSYAKCDNAHLYDLLPIPFREDAVKHIVQRIKTVQDFLEQKIAIENVSYYTAVAAEMDEATFISNIVNESDCKLLLDVNNVYVNSFNHKYNAKEFIKKLPLDKVAYIHMAGHLQVADDLIIDTHGENIIDPVFDLFDYTIQNIKPVPVLLERDFNFPELPELQVELNRLQKICDKTWAHERVA